MLREKQRKPKHKASNVSYFQPQNSSGSSSSQSDAFCSDSVESGTGESRLLLETACLNLGLPETADTQGSVRMLIIEREGFTWFLETCLQWCLSICHHHIFPCAHFPHFHGQHIHYWASVILNAYCARICLRNTFSSFLKLVLAH